MTENKPDKAKSKIAKSKMTLTLATKWFEFLECLSAERDIPKSVLITLALENMYGKDLKNQVVKTVENKKV
jgi:hypothetical protein